MKNLSKVMAVVLAFLMAMSTVSFAAFNDVAEDASYNEAVSILNALEILKGDTDGNFRPEDTIKRSEFAAVVCRLIGLGEAGENAKGQVVFADVAGEHWASGYIALASQQGIVNGKGNGIFDPDANVKYEEAVKMIVAALGYTPMAETNGGYPGGYQIVAAQKGILAGIKGIQGSAASRALVAQMCYNALEVPMMAQDGFGTEISYNYSDQLLLNKLGVTKFEGSVYATSASDNSIKADEVKLKYETQLTAIAKQSSALRYKFILGSVGDYEVNTKLYDCNPVVVDNVNTDTTTGIATAKVAVTEEIADAAAELLDYNTVMYVKDAETEDAELVAIAKKGSRNKVVEFKTEDINTKKTNLSENKVAVYTEDDDYETYDLKVEKIYVNGRTKSVDAACGVAAGAEIDTAGEFASVLAYYFSASKAADVKLLCGLSSSDEYNVVYITAYKDYVVDSISAKNYAITSKDNKKVIFDEEDKDARFTILKDGEKISFADIQVNDVISIAGYVADKELKYGTAIVTSQQVAGVVKTYDEDEATITIGEETYDYDKSKLAYDRDFRLGDEVTMYLNARGVLVGVDRAQSKTNLKYGFATLVYRSTGINNAFQLRVMDTEGNWKTLDFDDKVSFNGAVATDISGETDMDNWIGATGRIGTVGIDGAASDDDADKKKAFVNKVVGYETNADGEINKIYFKNDADPDAEDVYYTTYTGATPSYNEGTESFGNAFLSDSTVLFSVTGTITATADVREENVSIAKKDALVDRNAYTKSTVINADEDGYATVIFGQNLVGSIDKAAAFFTISAISTTTNDAGDKGKLITGIKAGEEATVFVKDTITAKKAVYAADKDFISDATGSVTLAKGDVIMFSKAANGEAKDVVVLLDASDYVGTTALGTIATAGVLKTFEVAGTDYAFVIGYASSINGSRVGIIDGATVDTTTEDDVKAGEVLYSIKSGATMTYYDAYYTAGSKKGETAVADASDIEVFEYELDDNGTEDDTSDDEVVVAARGDIVFARVVNDTSIEDVVIIKNNYED